MMEVLIVLAIAFAAFLLIEFVVLPWTERRDMEKAIAQVHFFRGGLNHPPRPPAKSQGGKVPPKPAPIDRIRSEFGDAPFDFVIPKRVAGNVPPGEFPRHPPHIP